jgi:hypothetical protein
VDRASHCQLRFGDQGHVAMSIETRDVIGQGYSAIRGFFHQYALTYITSDERDVIRLRTNYRKNEEVYLFRTTAAPPIVRSLFLEYLQRANSLHQRSEWYNALTNNCTTNIAVSVAQARDVRTRLDWRILLNGKMDEMMYERGGLVTDGLPLPALKKQAHINAAARAADDSRDFSILIRKGRVGFTERPSLAISVPAMAKKASESWTETLAKTKNASYDRVLPGHGAPGDEPRHSHSGIVRMDQAPPRLLIGLARPAIESR